jgi:hypothetical protein
MQQVVRNISLDESGIKGNCLHVLFLYTLPKFLAGYQSRQAAPILTAIALADLAGGTLLWKDQITQILEQVAASHGFQPPE